MDEAPVQQIEKPVNRRLIAYVSTVAALIVGSLTPWVTLFGIGISGVSIHYGIVSLVAAATLALLGYLSTRSVSSRALRGAAAGAAIAGLASLGSAIYVGWAIRSSVADDSGTSDNSLADAFVAALKPGVGFGLWLVLGGAVVAVLVAAPVALARAYSGRTLTSVAVIVIVLAGGGLAVADHKAEVDRRHAVAIAQAKAAAEAKAEADRQAAEEAAHAAEEAAAAQAEAEEAADRELYKVVTTSCASDEYGFSTDAKGKITNQGSKPRTYHITVRMLNKAGEQVSTAEDYVNDLPAGETATWSGSGFESNIARCDAATVEVSEY